MSEIRLDSIAVSSDDDMEEVSHALQDDPEIQAIASPDDLAMDTSSSTIIPLEPVMFARFVRQPVRSE